MSSGGLPGVLRDNVDHWRAAGAPASVIRVIQEGARLPFAQPVAGFRSRALHLNTPAEQQAWSDIEQTYLANGAIRKVEAHERVKCVSPCFIIKKKQAGHRFIVDLRKLNASLRKLRCKYGHLKQLQKARGCTALISFDLRDAYHHVGIHAEDQQYLGFTVGDTTYVCTALPFGLSVSPAIFMMVSRVIKCALLSGFDPDQPLAPLPPDPPWAAIMHYLDDFLLGTRDTATAQHFAERVIRLCLYLGFAIHFGKSTFDPSSCLVSLGLEVDVASGVFRVTAERAARLAQQAKRLLMTAASSARYVRSAEIASFAGLAQSCTLASPIYALHIRQLYTDLHSGPQSFKTRLTHQAMQDLKWFIKVPRWFQEHPIWSPPVPAGQLGQAALQQQQQQPADFQAPPVLYTDASLTGWGAVYREPGFPARQITLAGEWPPSCRGSTIHVLELKAVLLAVTALQRRLVHCRHLHLFCDNQPVMYMLRRWTTRDPASLPVLHRCAELFGRLRLRPAVSYVESSYNPADSPSRRWEPGQQPSTVGAVPWQQPHSHRFHCLQLL